MNPQISVVIPTYNRRQLLEQVSLSLKAQTLDAHLFEVIIVSDGSTDDTHAFLEDFCVENPNFRWFSQENKGPAAARNRGIQGAQGEIIAFTDDDCIVDENWLLEIKKAFEASPDACGVEGKTVSEPAKITPLTRQVVGESAGSFETCNIAYKKDILIHIGGFDEEYRYPAGEDVDLAYTVLRHGKIMFSDKVIVIHPPRKETLRGRLKQAWYRYWEFRLYDKHPEMYKKVRHEKTPWRTILITVLLSYFYHDVKREAKWMFKNPFIYFKFVATLIIERLFILGLLPVFFLRRILQRGKSRLG